MKISCSADRPEDGPKGAPLIGECTGRPRGSQDDPAIRRRCIRSATPRTVRSMPGFSSASSPGPVLSCLLPSWVAMATTCCMKCAGLNRGVG